MNERIRLLAEQCHHRYSEHNINLEKFAELIVRECGEIAAFGDPSYSAQYNIHKHFGVEK